MDQLGQDLTDAVNEIVNTISTADTAIQNEIGALTAAMQNGDAPAMQQAVTNLKTASATMKDDIKKMADSLLTANPPATGTAPAASAGVGTTSNPAATGATDPNASTASGLPAADPTASAGNSAKASS